MTNDTNIGSEGEIFADGPPFVLPVSGGLPPLVHLIEDHSTVEPGEASRAELSVRNISGIVESYDLTVLGPAAPWVEVIPTALSLFPGDEGTAVVTFRPPLSSSVVAGDYIVGVRAMSHVTRECTASDEILVSVSPFHRFATDISRTTFAVRTKAKSQIRIINQGNSTVTFRITAVDPEDYVHIVIPQREVTLAPGESVWVPILGKMAPRIFGSSNDTRTITATITAYPDALSTAPLLDVDPVEQRINILHKPFIRLRLGLFGRLVLLIAILALIAAFVFARILDNTPPEAVGAPPVPQAFRATLNDANQPVLTWDAAAGANQYSIYGIGTAGDPPPSAAPAPPVASTPALATPAASPAASPVLAPRDSLVIVPAVATSAPAATTPATASPSPSTSLPSLTGGNLESPVCDNCTEIATVDAGTTRYVVEKPVPGENCYRIAAKVGQTQSLYSPATCIIVPATNVLDTDGDGIADAPDANGDGIPETTDSNGDGIPDAPGDANGDGQTDAGAAPAAPAAPAVIAPCPPVKPKARAASTTTIAILWKKATKPPKGMTAPDPAASATPAAPTGGKDAAGSSTADTSNVCDPAKAITGWTVQRQIFTGWSDISPEAKADDTAIEIPDLTANTEYCFRMRAKAADANSVYSKKFCTMTLPEIDPAPSPTETSPSATPSPTASASAAAGSRSSGNLVP